MMLSGVWFLRGRCTQRWFVESTTMWPSDGEFCNSAREVPLFYRHSYRIPFSIFRASCCRIILHLFYLLSRIRHVLAACCDPRASRHRTTCRRVAATSSSRSVLPCASCSSVWCVVVIVLVWLECMLYFVAVIGCTTEEFSVDVLCTVCWWSVRSVSEIDDWLVADACAGARFLSCGWVSWHSRIFVISCDITHVL